MNQEKKNSVYSMTLAAMFLAIGLVLPILTGQIPQIGGMLLPMHLPVLLCSLICGWKEGLAVGLVLPVFRYFLFGMPPLFPTGAAMALELAAYGFFAGFFYARARFQCVISLYRSLIAAMLIGRAVWGVAQMALLGIGENGFTLQMFLAGAFLHAVPGIALQLVFIPAVMVAFNRAGLVRLVRHKDACPTNCAKWEIERFPNKENKKDG